jgi:protoporphyrinogen/coproporphyrinogen III oxidase
VKTAEKRSIVVVGAGISGLTVAYKLQQLARRMALPIQLTVLESTKRSGGLIETRRIHNSIIETGPEAFMTMKPAAMNLAIELGLKEQLVKVNPNLRTKIFWRQQLHALPEGFVMFAPTKLSPLVTTPLFSLLGKARMACDLLIPRAGGSEDESLADFVLRRLGREALDRLAEPLIAGIYSGDPSVLSAASTVPRLRQLEEEHGSLVKGLWKQTQQNQGARGDLRSNSYSFKNGLEQLTDSLKQNLEPGSLIQESRVATVVPGFWKQWRVVCSNSRTFEADEVIFATPASVASEILNQTDGIIAERLQEVKYNQTVILNLLFRKEDVDLQPSDSGFVVPRTENELLRACTFSSNKFESRTPSGLTAIRLYGRTSQGKLQHENDEEITELLLGEARSVLNIRNLPMFSSVTRHRRGIPQYAVGHKELMAKIEKLLVRLPGLSLIGNAYSGVGISDCIERANVTAAQVIERTSLCNRGYLVS